MLHSHSLRIALLGLLASGAIGCNVQVDQIFEMKEGSGLDTFWVLDNPPGFEIPQGRLEFQGGTSMRIHVSTTILDYLDGTVDGDVEIRDLLFAIPNLTFLIVNTGLICVALDDPPGGGTFRYDVLGQTAAFDMVINTEAMPTLPVFAKAIKDGRFQFPFDLEAEIPLSLLDALGLFTGTGSMEVTQHIDEQFTVYVKATPTTTTEFIEFWFAVRGDVTLASTDTFPATPKVLECVDFLAGPGV